MLAKLFYVPQSQLVAGAGEESGVGGRGRCPKLHHNSVIGAGTGGKMM